MRPAQLDRLEPSASAKSFQCGVVLGRLKEGAATTDQLRELAVRSPAARVLDLRRAGCSINTGIQGGQALYTLVRGVS
jgi:hypothetical protein